MFEFLIDIAPLTFEMTTVFDDPTVTDKLDGLTVIAKTALVKPVMISPNRATFKNFGRDLAIGLGTGLRFDFSYFLLRFDLAYRVKDPARQQNNGWMSIKNFAITETRSSGLKVNNLALQFGIGLPF